jgi:hypothetical protein
MEEVRREWVIAARPSLNYVRALLGVHRNLQAHPELLQAPAAQHLKVDAALACDVAHQYRQVSAWDVNGGSDVNGLGTASISTHR